MALPTEFDISGATYYAVAPSGYSYSGEQDTYYSTRKYTSLAAAIAAVKSAGTPTTPIVINAIGEWTTQEEFATATVISGINTTGTNYLLVRGIGAARHDGKFSTTAWRGRLNNTSGNVLNIQNSYVTIQGLQFYMTQAPEANTGAIQTESGSSILLDALIVKGHGNTSTGAYSAGLYFVGSTGTIEVRNCVVYDWRSSGANGFGICPYTSSAVVTLRNCTIHNSDRGIFWATEDSGSTATNCVVQDCASACFSGNTHGGATNVADDGTAQGTGPINGEVTFADEANDDYHLSASDTVALGAGTNLSAYFTIDIDGDTRSTPWSVGSDAGPSFQSASFTSTVGVIARDSATEVRGARFPSACGAIARNSHTVVVSARRTSTFGTVARNYATVSSGNSSQMTSTIGVVARNPATASRGSAATVTTGAVAKSSLVLPRVICYGNSFTAGYGLSNPSDWYPAKLAVLLAGRAESVVNRGTSAVKTTWLDANFDTMVTPYVVAGQPTILVLQELFNSIYGYGDPPESTAQIMAALWSICTKAHALGMRVIVWDCAVVGASYGVEPQLTECCTVVESTWPLHAEGFVRTRELFTEPTSSLYQSDQLHPSADGTTALASMVAAQINRLLASKSAAALAAAGAIARNSATTSSGNSASFSSVVGVVARSQVAQTQSKSATLSGGAVALDASAYVQSKRFPSTTGAIALDSSTSVQGKTAAFSVGAVAGVVVSQARHIETEATFGAISRDFTTFESGGVGWGTFTSRVGAVASSTATGVHSAAATSTVGAVVRDYSQISTSQSISMIGIVAGVSASQIRSSVAVSTIGAIANLHGTTSSNASGFVHPFTSHAQVYGDGLTGNLLLLTCSLVDANGAKVNTDAEVHVFQNGVQTSRVTRSTDAVTYNGTSGEYRAELSFSAPTLASFHWHFPSITHRATPVSRCIRGPVLTEPT